MATGRFLLLISALLSSAGVSLPAGAWAQVLSGLDVLVKNQFQELQGKRIGLITNQTGKTKDGRSAALAFSQAPGVELAALFSPEHGFTGAIEDGAVSSDTLRLSKGKIVPIHSLYGSTKAPTPEMLSGLDALVFDIQDVGARFYTYATTMGMALESAASAHIDFYVLDRPNPIRGDITEGLVLSTGIRHFTAYFSIPVRHGLTMGEIARFYNLDATLGANLHVAPLRGWRREMWYEDTKLPWTKPSPNMPDVEAAALYPGIGCFESTNISVGRGTPIPFRWIGAPWMDAGRIVKRLKKAGLPGARFSTKTYTPEKSVFKGIKSKGIRIRVKDRDKIRSLSIFAHLACALRDIHPDKFEIRWMELRRMVGSDRFQELYLSGADPQAIIRRFEEESQRFQNARGSFLLY